MLNPLFWGEKGGGVSPRTGIVKILETVLLSVVLNVLETVLLSVVLNVIVKVFVSVVATVGYVQLKFDAALEMRILVSSQVGYGDSMASVKTDEFPKS